ncbi:hypothetical protein OJ997_34580 [Solirubrobacter phytolaccae]|uniref:Uncharacterized protein n=1 Tax=Solirubrobacter phytolaccae TaxID=1404360 RepID=A0A9X3NF33_9ACTN|nr:hypothetical protein [Solirubrobacter phytolaccae]MDA0185485.1 hypothetical protein [Solirubrobacter phytolaccae]
MNRRLVLFTVLATGGFSAPAAAQDCEAPPGTAAIEQYCESVPDATGNRATRKGDTRGETRSKDPQPQVDEPTLREIEDAGAQGEQLGRVLRGGDAPQRKQEKQAETREAKVEKPKPTRTDTAAQRTPVDTPVPVQAGSPLSAVGAAVSGGDTVGGAFPLVLLTIAVLIGGAGWIRRGRGGR